MKKGLLLCFVALCAVLLLSNCARDNGAPAEYAATAPAATAFTSDDANVAWAEPAGLSSAEWKFFDSIQVAGTDLKRAMFSDGKFYRVGDWIFNPGADWMSVEIPRDEMSLTRSTYAATSYSRLVISIGDRGTLYPLEPAADATLTLGAGFAKDKSVPTTPVRGKFYRCVGGESLFFANKGEGGLSELLAVSLLELEFEGRAVVRTYLSGVQIDGRGVERGKTLFAGANGWKLEVK